MIRDRWIFGRAAGAFTLQWHLTNACSGHCRHCYDRSDRRELPLPDALAVLADLQAFCRRRRVEPRLSLSGGDPLRYSHFWELYEAVARTGIAVSILGNPIDPADMARLLRVARPGCYQVSLEGLREHNDAVRGTGHFDRAMHFLAEARRRGLRTHVMLTLTGANLDQVVPLGQHLRGLTARFTFNRLAHVGEAADLEPLDPRRFREFLGSYLAARRINPVLGVKENLLSLVRVQSGRRPFSGCTGYGCGAAFNFVALLPDGEVHACRKFPSPIGDIRQSSLEAIYDSAAAKRYRAGSTACRGCRLRRHCGGCLAVTFGQRLDPLQDRDPYCFLDSR
jgi:selenobiotic family peptide radical SAM maturase